MSFYDNGAGPPASTIVVGDNLLAEMEAIEASCSASEAVCAAAVADATVIIADAASVATEAATASAAAASATASAAAASTSATSAASSTTSATASATSATASATSATASATSATASATSATASAATATTEAGVATTQATSATASATAAGSSATSASTSAASALASLNSFIDTYLGAQSSAPTLNGTGGAIVAGNWYFDTSLGYTLMYAGSSWQAISTASSPVTSWNSRTGAVVPATNDYSFSQISGSVATTQLPNPSATTLGGVQSLASSTSKWINTISTAGAPSATQPAFTDISGTIAATQITDAALQSHLSGGGLNKFRNVTMSIAQRGAVTVAAGTTAYTLDGWMVSATGANAVVSQVKYEYPVSAFALSFAGATGLTDVKVRQRIESIVGVPLACLSGTTPTVVTVTFVVQVNGSGTIATPTLTVNYPTSQDNYTTVTPIISAVALQTPTLNTPKYLSYTFTSNVNAWMGMEVILDLGAIPSGQTYYIAAADIRATQSLPTGLNSSPPPLELRTPVDDLFFCQRYFQTSYGNDVVPGTATRVGLQSIGSTIVSGFYDGSSTRFPINMRAAPTIAYWDGAGNASMLSSLTGSTTWTDNTAPTNSNVGLNAGSTGFTNNVEATTGSSATWFFHYTASAEL